MRAVDSQWIDLSLLGFIYFFFFPFLCVCVSRRREREEQNPREDLCVRKGRGDEREKVVVCCIKKTSVRVHHLRE